MKETRDPARGNTESLKTTELYCAQYPLEVSSPPPRSTLHTLAHTVDLMEEAEA